MKNVCRWLFEFIVIYLACMYAILTMNQLGYRCVCNELARTHACPPVEVVEPVETVDITEPPAIQESEKTDPGASEAPLQPVIEETRYFDVPLSEDLQDYIFALCENREIDPAIVIAMIRHESNYDPMDIGDGGNSYGLMQVQPRWHSDRMEKLGVSDLFDPYQNVLVGVDYLDEMLDEGEGMEWALRAYNGGPYRGWNPNEKVNTYVKVISGYMKELKRVEDAA